MLQSWIYIASCLIFHDYEQEVINKKIFAINFIGLEIFFGGVKNQIAFGLCLCFE